MKLSCTKDNLRTGLAITSHVPTKNVNLPILNNVLMVAQNGAIRLTATNLEVAVSCLVRGKVDEPGELTVPSKLFFDYLNLLPNEKIDLWTEDYTLFVECGSYKTKIHGVPAADFPLVPSVSAQHTYQASAEAFRRALARVLFAAASNESRPELSGIFLRFQPGGKGKLVLAATDSYRLSEQQIERVDGSSDEATVIVPSRTMSEIARILSVFKDDADSPTDLVMQLSENQIVFTYGTVELTSRIIEGTYPDYRQIIPTAFQTESRMDREDFIQAVKAASLFSQTGLFDVTLQFDPSGTVSARAVDASRGENTATCPLKQITGQTNDVTLNYRYLLDGLQSMEDDEILFQMIDGSNPCLIRSAQKEKEGVYIVMPIRQ
ncbi:DNA polymerase III subunit beta [Candidatus Uhrbacteria bacterium]|nr:DNA polymerase III subunit beta [Candidatus Uhrbacteria bacterium]